MRLLNGILALLASIIISNNLLAQSNYENLTSRYNNRFVELDSLVFKVKPTFDSSFNEKELDTFLLDSLIDESTKAQIKTYNTKTGLEFTSQAYYRSNAALVFFGDDDDYSEFRIKAQAEVRWYLFQSSIFGRKGFIKEKEIEGSIQKLSYSKEEIRNLLEQDRINIKHRYDSLLYSVLYQKIINLELLAETQRYLLENENISSEALLQIINEKAEAQRQLLSLDYSIDSSSLLLPNIAPMIVNLNSESFINYVKENNTEVELLSLEQELLKQKSDNVTYLSSLRLAPFARYSYYETAKRYDVHNLDLGIVLSMPLSFDTKQKRKEYETQSSIIEVEKINKTTQIIERIQVEIEQMQKNNRLIIGELAQLKELKDFLWTRTVAYNNNIGGYSLMLRINEYNAYLESLENLLHYQYLRDCSLLELQTYLGLYPIGYFCTTSFMEY